MTKIESFIYKAKTGTLEEIREQLGWSIEGTLSLMKIATRKNIFRKIGDKYVKIE